ncbi:MAG: ABC transporter ATP-binding protein [Bacteroidales bacterium]|nr:ABC transporter ATP-binding protein [Clostridium sp.]MCM1203904.1 ABC transporter ATP-binding protein [Bacteroidales bacterium]
MSLVECKALTKCYSRKLALNQINLNLEPGKIIGLLGPNGSGKTTLIKICAGLLTPTSGTVTIKGMPVGPETKAVVAYLPERTYLGNWTKVKDIFNFFEEMYTNFQKDVAFKMLRDLGISPEDKLNTMSKGTREKVQLILVMSRKADLYLLDEPMGGVDPAARDYILNTIITNYNPEGSILISTHLIADVENILEDVIMIKQGNVVCHDSVDNLRINYDKSLDQVFREVFRC